MTLAASLFAASGAQAQNCGSLATPFGNVIGLFGSAVSRGRGHLVSITAANTAFLTQSTAFVSAPANPQPGQEGGGVWVRGVGGELNLKSSSTVSGTESVPGLHSGTGGTTCATKFHESYGGVQVGSDVARLNLDGWNVHLGTTAGAMWSSGNIVGGSPSAPDRFGRRNRASSIQYDIAISLCRHLCGRDQRQFLRRRAGPLRQLRSQPEQSGINLFGQKDDAHGISVSGSVGYNYQVPNSKWFIEPSAGLIWSRTKVGALNVNTPFGGLRWIFGHRANQRYHLNHRAGRIARRHHRSSRAISSYQPFVAASVWHDFASNITGTYQSCANCLFVRGGPQAIGYR